MPRSRRTFVTCLAVMLAATAPAWAGTRGSGTAASEHRTVGDFQAVSASGHIDVVISQGPTALTVRADANLLPLLETVVEQGSQGATLVLRWKRGESVQPKTSVQVTLATPRLVAFSGSGSGDLRLESFSTPALKLALSGSGDALLNQLSTDDLAISLSGSCDVAGSGKAARLRVSVSGSGDVKLSALQSDAVTVNIAGSGDALVNAQKTLDVSIAGSGDVRYVGAPAVKSSVAGSGSVHPQ